MGRARHGPGSALTALEPRRANAHSGPADVARHGWADHTFEAVLCEWEGAAVADAHDDASAIRDRTEALCGAGVHVGLVSDTPIELVDAQMRARPVGPGTLHLLIVGAGVYACDAEGVRQIARDETGPAGLVRWMTTMLWDRGIGSGLVLVVGDALAPFVAPLHSDPGLGLPELRRATVAPSRATQAASTARDPTSPPTLLQIIDEQLGRRAAGRVPDIDQDPAWMLALPTPSHPADLAVQETLYTLADGRFGTRGSLEETHDCGSAHVVAAGVYTDTGERRTLQAAPDWTTADGLAGTGGRRVLDMRTGVLWRETSAGARSIRFSSCATPGVMATRIEAAPARLDPGAALRPCDAARLDGCGSSARSTGGGGITAAARQVRRGDGSVATVERLAGYVADPARAPTSGAAERVLAAAVGQGFDALLAEQRASWAGRWADALVTIEGDEQAQFAVRFALFHLLSTVTDSGEAAVGARGLSGPAYDGHVFWDADVFVMPVLAATRPQAARAMLRYRTSRLDAARRRARRLGFAGALWPWESTDDGEDVTPTSTQDRDGTTVPIRTGAAEHHIVADVAWAACHYVQWTGDRAFLRPAGMRLVIEGARFWASRVSHTDDGHAHINGVIGPDEYHELVDDNAFTNVMARWNLRRAADLAQSHDAADPREIARWRSIASAIVDGYDARSRCYEQFAGFADLTPLIISEIAEPPVAADLLLGRDVVATSQVVKQADVLMLHHLVPDEVEPDSLRANLDLYGPRTAHGSSLSPAIHAAAWARAGEPDRALDLFRVAARLDLDDVTGTTAAGLHVATFGGTWQALAHGFLGLRATTTGLAVDPILPASWDALQMNVRFRGARVALRATHDALHVTSDRPLDIRLGVDRMLSVAPTDAGLVVALDDDRTRP